MATYSMVGQVSMSPVAYRLAAENALDLLCMTYKENYGEVHYMDVGGWMVAAGMDKEAASFFLYLNKRVLTDQRSVYSIHKIHQLLDF